MITTNMNLELPTVTVTLGPEWATELNAALEVVDAHDHTSGKGVPVPVSGLNINADLNLGNFRVTEAKSVQHESQATTLVGASNANSVYTVLGDLYYTNGSGTAVQITDGGTVVTAPASIQSFETVLVNTNLVIGPTDTFVFLFVDTSVSPKSITLPAASAVVAGRLYIVKDVSGNSEVNNITVNRAGADLIDGQTSLVISSNFATSFIVGDGTSAWSVS